MLNNMYTSKKCLSVNLISSFMPRHLLISIISLVLSDIFAKLDFPWLSLLDLGYLLCLHIVNSTDEAQCSIYLHESYNLIFPHHHKLFKHFNSITTQNKVMTKFKSRLHFSCLCILLPHMKILIA